MTDCSQKPYYQYLHVAALTPWLGVLSKGKVCGELAYVGQHRGTMEGKANVTIRGVRREWQQGREGAVDISKIERGSDGMA